MEGERGRLNHPPCKQEMKETDEELQARLESFSEDQKEVSTSLQRLQHKAATCQKQIEELRQNGSRLTQGKGSLTARIKQLVRPNLPLACRRVGRACAERTCCRWCRNNSWRTGTRRSSPSPTSTSSLSPRPSLMVSHAGSHSLL